MPRGHVARQRGGRQRVLSAINAKTAWLYVLEYPFRVWGLPHVITISPLCNGTHVY
jgi:hypothetical protein